MFEIFEKNCQFFKLQNSNFENYDLVLDHTKAGHVLNILSKF